MKAIQTKVHEVAFLSNTFVRSPLAFNNLEARIFALALGCLHQKEDTLAFRLHFEDITYWGSSGGKQYAELAAAQQRLTQPIINTTLKNGKSRRDAIALFTFLSLDEGTNQVTGEFNPRLREHLLDLTGSFTTVELMELLTLKSAHTQRLFWIMRSYHNQKWQEAIPFDTLREWLFGVNSDQYTDWTDFNRYVLKPAIASFRAIGWAVAVTTQKRGRRVDSLVFTLTNLNEAKATPVLATGTKVLTLVEIAQFRDQLQVKDKALPLLYDRLRLDFELKEYQAREVVNGIKSLNDLNAVQKALYQVRLDLSNSKPIKSVAAYTLSQIKGVLPVYQSVAPVSKTRRGRVRSEVEEELRETQDTLDYVASNANGLHSPAEQKVRQKELQARINELRDELK